MKWSWKIFSLHLAVYLVLGLACTYALSSIIDTIRGPGGPDSTRVSLAAGGFIAPLVIAALGGWKGSRPKPIFAAGVIVATLCSSNPGLGIFEFISAGISYYGSRKARTILFYLLPTKAPEPTPNDPPS